MKLADSTKGFFLTLACAVVAAVGVSSGSKLQVKRIRRSFVRSLDYKYTLRICNAYPFSSALDVYMQNSATKLTDEPMIYKTCKDFTPQVKVGDRVDFKIGDTAVGTFTISDLPNNDAVLLMIVYRHDTASNAIAFESHVFSNVGTAQVAVLDVHRGRGRSELRVERTFAPKDADDGFPAGAPQSEMLQFDSVVAVDSGVYKLALQGVRDSKTKAEVELVALPREAYVAIRCGVDADEGPDYPEDLIVFPRSDKAAFGGVSCLRPSSAMLLVLAYFALSWQQDLFLK